MWRINLLNVSAEADTTMPADRPPAATATTTTTTTTTQMPTGAAGDASAEPNLNSVQGKRRKIEPDMAEEHRIIGIDKVFINSRQWKSENMAQTYK
jgi:hypothetical protein